MMTVIDVIDVLANNKCGILLDSFKYTKISRDVEQVGNISAADKMKLAVNIANAKNAVEVKEITDEASKIAYEKSHLKFNWKNNNYPIKSVSYNETRPNVSMMFYIDGEVELPSDSPANLSKNFYTHIYRNFNIIHDGILNISMMKVKMNNNLYNDLKNNGVIINNCGNDIYEIDFTFLPIVNISTNDLSAMDFADINYQTMKAKASNKVLKYFLDELQPVNNYNTIYNLYGEESCEYLKNLGVSDGGFNPKSKLSDVKSTYKAKELLIKFKGMSNIPSYNAFIKKFNDKKKLNDADMLLKIVYDICINNKKNMSENDFITWLKNEIIKNSNCIEINNKKLNEIRFNVIVGNKWFKEFSDKNDCYYKYNGIDVEIVEQEKDFEI